MEDYIQIGTGKELISLNEKSSRAAKMYWRVKA